MNWRPTILVIAALILAGVAAWGCFGVTNHLIVAVDKVSADADDLHGALVRINGPTGPITETDKLLLALRSTTVHADMAIAHEERQLNSYDRMSQQLFVDVDGLAKRGTETLTATTQTAQEASAAIKTANATIGGLQPLEASLTATAQASTRTVDTLNARISDPRIDHLMTSLDGTMAHVDGTTSDIQGAIHKVTNPPPCKGRWCWAITPAKFIWEMRDLPEPVYYLGQLFHF